MISKILAALKDGVVGLGKRLVGLISQDARAEGIRQKWVSPLPEKAVSLTNRVASDLLKWLIVAGFPPPANPMVPLFMASAARPFCCRGVFFFLASLTPGGAVAVVSMAVLGAGGGSGAGLGLAIIGGFRGRTLGRIDAVTGGTATGADCLGRAAGGAF